MNPAVMCARTHPARLREARRHLLEHGEVRGELIEPVVHRSWQRSRDFGLVPNGHLSGAPHASGAQLARALTRQHELISYARPMMDFLFEQTDDIGSLVILADAQGMVLHSLGEGGFVERAKRVALRPGAVWHEQWRGTNAIGTALADAAPVVVHAGEHYLERNGFLTCTASPIIDPCGQLLGALDISGDHRSYNRHTLGLVCATAKLIEHRLFEHRHAGHLRLRLHAQPEGLGTVTEGLIALSEGGWIIGANTMALKLLGLTWRDVGAMPVDQVLAVDFSALANWYRQNGDLPRTLRRHDGEPLWARVEANRAVLSAAVCSAERRGTAPAGRDALAELETGDPALQATVARARRVLDKPIALLLQGESGTGKEVMARAVHASGPRRHRPFVAVNCAALPDTLIEAELFGYRPGAFTGAAREGAVGRMREADGGTLFLDEIGDMPLLLQSRLLRVLQERSVQPLGGGKAVPVDFQLVCATHRRLRAEMEAGRFREDLYYRLNGLTLHLPALRERKDFAQLVRRLLEEVAPGRALQLAPELSQAFARYGWPGNVRQLANALRTACALLYDDETEIGWAHVPDDLSEELAETPRRMPVDEDSDLRLQSTHTVTRVVCDSQGNLSEAARRLGISRNTLYRKLAAAQKMA
jgi:transcriptional regulator of acetoin/glycerol metabolism